MSTTEHDPNDSDALGQASQEENSNQAGTPISLDDATVKALVNHPTFQAVITDIAEKKSQATKDRRIAGLENQVSDILSKLDLTPEQQNRVKEIERDNLLSQLQKAVLEGGSPGGQANPTGGTPVNIIGAFAQAGYDPNAISIVDWEWAENFKGDDVALANALAKRRLSGGQTNEAEPNLAAAMPGGSTVSTPATGSQAALQNGYQAELKNIRPGDFAALTALKAKYRKQGLDIF